MARRIANPTVVKRASERLADGTRETPATASIAAILAQFDRLPDRADAFDPLDWDADGLPQETTP
jgi:antitoxin VapB